MVGALVSMVGGRLPHADCARLEPVSRRLLGLRFRGSGQRNKLWQLAVQHMSAARVAMREHCGIAALSIPHSLFVYIVAFYKSREYRVHIAACNKYDVS